MFNGTSSSVADLSASQRQTISLDIREKFVSALAGEHPDILAIGGTGHVWGVLDVFQDSSGGWFIRMKDPRGSDLNPNVEDHIEDGVNDGEVVLAWGDFADHFIFVTDRSSYYAQAYNPTVTVGVNFVAAGTYSPWGNRDALIVDGTDKADSITIHHNGAGSFTVKDETTGRTFSSPAGVSIEYLQVRTFDGDDVVRYVLDSNVTNDVTINVQLGDGNDRFTGTMGGDISNNHRMSAFIHGGTGDDLMTMYATETVPVRDGDHLKSGHAINANGMRIGTGATFELGMYGYAGNDRVFFDYTGVQKGALKLDLQGGDNQDTVSAIVDLKTGSTRGVGTSNSPAYVRGDRDNDKVTFKIFDRSGNNVSNNAHIDGGWDVWEADDDEGVWSSNVTPHWL